MSEKKVLLIDAIIMPTNILGDNLSVAILSQKGLKFTD
jgi:hypothetical protein